MPCADFGLLKPLKRSPEYASIRKRVANPKPVDAWQANTVHYFLFELRPLKEAPESAVVPVALFTMQWEYDGPVMALVITPNANGEQAEVVNLRQPEIVQHVPLSGE